MKGTTGDHIASQISDAIAEHAELAAFLGMDANFPTAEGWVLTPLQHHLAAAGRLLGRARAGRMISSGEVTRATRATLTYLDLVQPIGPRDYYEIHQLAASAPNLATSLIRASWRTGKSEFRAVMKEFDHAFSRPGQNRTRLHVRQTVALEAFLCDGDQTAAAQRLEPLARVEVEKTPEQQVELLSKLAVSFSRIGLNKRARELIASVHKHTFGYAIAARKDPQYVLWRDLMVNANRLDPQERSVRVRILLRVVGGMMCTEGRDSGHRIAAELLTEAASDGGALGIVTAKALADAGAISWSALVNALMLGTVRRRPEESAACSVIWVNLCLPYYTEPHYRPEALGDFITEVVAVAPPIEATGIISLLSRAIETDSRPEVRADLIRLLLKAADLRGLATNALQQTESRWRAETPPTYDHNTPGTYDAVASLTELQAVFEASAAMSEDGEPAYDGTNAFTRLLKADPNLVLAKNIFDRWPLLQKDNRSRFSVVDCAIAAGEIGLARSITSDYKWQEDPWGSWSRWHGGGRLRYFRARLAIEGPSARVEAFADLCLSLSAGREDVTNLLVDFSKVFPLIVEEPNWAAMWDDLSENIELTREYQLGTFLPKPRDIGDNGARIELLKMAIELSQREILRGVRMAVRTLSRIAGGEGIFVDICETLLQGQDDQPLLAVQILAGDDFYFARNRLIEPVRAVTQGLDFAAAQFARHVLVSWGEPVIYKISALPSFYSIILSDSDKVFIASPTVRATALDDPLGLMRMFSGLIRVLARDMVTTSHILRRCRYLIDLWGGSKAAVQRDDDLKDSLSRLNMRVTYMKPSTLTALRALRFVIGEMRLAGLFDEPELEALVRKLTQPALGELDLLPAPRPVELARPPLTTLDSRVDQDMWLDGVRDDLIPFQVDGMVVIAEIYKLKRFDIRRESNVCRVKMPYEVVDGDIEDNIPTAVWVDGVKPLSDVASPMFVRALRQSELGGAPRLLLTICPFWLQRLSWRCHSKDRSVFIDASGRTVARMTWWRDGLKHNVSDSGFWSDGVLLTVTVNGCRQIEAINGSLTIFARATRTRREDSEKELNARAAETRYDWRSDIQT